MKKIILIVALTILPALSKAQVLNKTTDTNIGDPECFEYYQPCAECLEGTEKWHNANPNNPLQVNNSLKNNAVTTRKNFFNKTVNILGRPVRVVTAIVGSVLMAILISKTTTFTNAITTQ